MFPGIDLCDAMLVAEDNYLLTALNATTIGSACRNALAHATGRGVDDLAYALLPNGHAYLPDQTYPIRNILNGFALAVAKDACQHHDDECGHNDATDSGPKQGKRQQPVGQVMEDIAEEAETEQKENNCRRIQKCKEREAASCCLLGGSVCAGSMRHMRTMGRNRVLCRVHMLNHLVR